MSRVEQASREGRTFSPSKPIPHRHAVPRAGSRRRARATFTTTMHCGTKVAKHTSLQKPSSAKTYVSPRFQRLVSLHEESLEH